MEFSDALNSDESWKSSPEPEYGHIHETPNDGGDMEENVMKFAKLENLNRITDVALDIELAISTDADTKRFKELRGNCVFAGNMLIRDFDQGNLSDDQVINFGKDINRLKNLCEKRMKDCVNF